MEESTEAFLVRKLELNDYSKGFIELLSQLTACPHITEEDFHSRFHDLQSLSQDHVICVIENPNSHEIVATASLFVERKFIRNCGKVGHIEDVVVDSRVRGLGLGQMVVKYLSDYARSAGCYKVILGCAVENKGFYEKCGFKEKGVLMSLYL
ncbi:glucosamine 6-phosphate N-acetyltransferase [Amborella trichopoda]|uniref:Glucosamine 6-phosphate N-acetyltransferase n=1 Tax=Amborella trichopoda TaxID=13333 RepID=W1PNX8_AMBTC|nr:glucosamine 6-phosphate N-acetyltransferase [Amborella trichopoda]ERN11702.1 hypothetical protein AMTR_s00022p00228120 [Amborella trichopoda]|eukprot:XP_006850121.1 glucosamine 6-phosphate N-acetyltransferase [Amborella trichopoda]